MAPSQPVVFSSRRNVHDGVVSAPSRECRSPAVQRQRSVLSAHMSSPLPVLANSFFRLFVSCCRRRL